MKNTVATLLVLTLVVVLDAKQVARPPIALDGADWIQMAANDSRCARCFFRAVDGGGSSSCLDTVGARSMNLNISVSSYIDVSLPRGVPVPTGRDIPVFLNTAHGVRRAQMCFRNIYSPGNSETGNGLLRVALSNSSTNFTRVVPKWTDHSVSPAVHVKESYDSVLWNRTLRSGGLRTTTFMAGVTSADLLGADSLDLYHDDQGDETTRTTNTLISYGINSLVPRASVRRTERVGYCSPLVNSTTVITTDNDQWYDWFDYLGCEDHLPLGSDAHNVTSLLDSFGSRHLAAGRVTMLQFIDPNMKLWECNECGLFYDFKKAYSSLKSAEGPQVSITWTSYYLLDATYLRDGDFTKCNLSATFRETELDVWCLPDHTYSFDEGVSVNNSRYDGLTACANGTLTNSSTCLCSDRYIGRSCELDSHQFGYSDWTDYVVHTAASDICATIGDYVCSGTGRCVASESDFTCVCDEGWFGDPYADSDIYASAFLPECFNSSSTPSDDAAVNVPEAEVLAVGLLRQCLFWDGKTDIEERNHIKPGPGFFNSPALETTLRDVGGVAATLVAPKCSGFRGGPGCAPCAGYINGSIVSCIGMCTRHDDSTPRCTCLASQPNADPLTGCHYPMWPTAPDGSFCSIDSTGSSTTLDPVGRNATHGRNCLCARGWSGDDCSTPICPVAVDPLGNSTNVTMCGGHGDCNVNTAQCQCAVGWESVVNGTSHYGEVVGACTRRSCENNCSDKTYTSGGVTRSICDFNVSNPVCHCELNYASGYGSRFYGEDCGSAFSVACGETECSGNGYCSLCDAQLAGAPDRNANAVCASNDGPPVCTCRPGWHGSQCQTSHCSGDRAGCNGYDCLNSTGSYACSCGSGTFGRLCQFNATTAPGCTTSGHPGLICGGSQAGSCVDNGTCVCNHGFNGARCQFSTSCTNCTGESCTAVDPLSPTTAYQCTCGARSSYKGPFAPNSGLSCDTLLCNTTTPDGSACDCGSTGTYLLGFGCRKLCPFSNGVECGVLTSGGVSRCTPVLLSNPSNATCDCGVGIGVPGDSDVTVSAAGDTCTSFCGGRCFGSGESVCRSPANTTDCPTAYQIGGVCQYTGGDCLTKICANGGVAGAVNGSFICSCLPPYTSESNCVTSRCGAFAFNFTSTGACVCPQPGWRLDPVSHGCVSTCQNGGTNVGPTNGTCVCVGGYSGPTCANPPINPCTPPKRARSGPYCNVSTCGLNGHPSDNENDCLCDVGYEQAVTQNIPTCVSRCRHGSPTVNVTAGTYTCACGALTFNGTACVEPAVPCNGRGRLNADDLNCSCNAGFAGALCEVDTCNVTANPKHAFSDSGCVCKPPWTGYPECATHTCGIGCPVPTVSTRTPQFLWNFTTECDTDIYRFSTSTLDTLEISYDSTWACRCAVHEQIIRPVGGVLSCVANCDPAGSVEGENNVTSPTIPCVCKSGFSGTFCDQFTQPSSSSPAISEAGVVAIAVTSVVAVCGALALWYFKFYRGRAGYVAATA